ncbi:MAG: zinc-finger domain-containing protein [Gammaproteobacteria bacterium]|jgi:uncharacterized Zn-finger protein
MNQTAEPVSFTVSSSELPASCPPKNSSVDGLHPRVYLKFKDDGKAKCPYCGARFEIKD